VDIFVIMASVMVLLHLLFMTALEFWVIDMVIMMIMSQGGGIVMKIWER